MRRKIIVSRNPCNLTWEEQNPTNYIYSSSEAIERLKKTRPKNSLKRRRVKMVDISMCSGEGCSRKKDCFRFTAIADKYRQSHFAKPPVKKDGVNCDYFMLNKNLGEIFDDAMKKEGFKPIPVGPLPLGKLRKFFEKPSCA